MREYEIVFIMRASETDEAVDAFVAQMEELAKQRGAELLKVDKWGRRKLAYEIGKQHEGYYVFIHLNAETAAINELERRFKLSEAVIRFLSVRIDDETRRSQRRAALRAKRKGVEPGAQAELAARRPRDEEAEEEEEEERGAEEEEGEA